jgi:hypothetical protein
MYIILLRGYSQSGKDFVGKILCEQYGFKRFAFADSLKKIVAKNFQCELDQLHSQSGKLEICPNDSRGRTYRQILIDEAFRLREMDAGIFAKFCCQDILSNGPSERIVITDWRYPNELDIIARLLPGYGITAVHIKRQGQDRSPVNDISEYHLADRANDYKIINTMDTTIYNEIAKLMHITCNIHHQV